MNEKTARRKFPAPIKLLRGDWHATCSACGKHMVSTSRADLVGIISAHKSQHVDDLLREQWNVGPR